MRVESHSCVCVHVRTFMNIRMYEGSCVVETYMNVYCISHGSCGLARIHVYVLNVVGGKIVVWDHLFEC